MSKRFIATVAFSSLFLVACGQTATESIHSSLEEAAEIENEGFDEQQQPMMDAEEHEAELYSQIVDLDMDAYDEIVRLADEAIASVGERRELLSNEQESIEEGYNVFENAVADFSELEDENLVDLANDVQEAMDNRYASYQDLHTIYEESLDLDEQLYEMLKDEELDAETLTAHIEETNQKYEERREATEQFNEYTTAYNDAKRAFYEASDLEVRFE
ncbi:MULTISPECIES: YkyA family protein [Shouchella]|uniref:YkyA family protein n=2 Tax=Shouchella TaxID=2893057 RepID=A0ABY7W4N0_9BACI|nr:MULTISPECIES: YkyA family protein [Shouchella]MED4127449.1 YkyA family protein [Shouchella miscanthi]WDF03917.1 YkyA family protein [Shouchella hunanensis]